MFKRGDSVEVVEDAFDHDRPIQKHVIHGTVSRTTLTTIYIRTKDGERRFNARGYAIAWKPHLRLIPRRSRKTLVEVLDVPEPEPQRSESYDPSIGAARMGGRHRC